MLDRLAPGVSTIAVVGFFVLAMAVPFIAVQATPTRQAVRRAALVAAVASYTAALLAYTLLPLPDPGELTRACASGGDAEASLTPLGFLADREGGQAPLASVADPGWSQVLLNVALFVPFGLALGWRLSLGRVALLALATIVLIELTQLTGLWFAYDCAYRTFDVDDLWAGVLGAWLGAVAVHRARRAEPPQRPVRN
ncbi:MAG: VanZ family protein [Ornithinimicrobium sp.]